MERAKMNNISGWLTLLPMSQDHYDLTAQEFCDALALRYWKPLLNVPSSCDDCGAPFSLDHALICRKGGLIIQHYSEVRDAVGDLATLVWGQVVSEPVVRDASANCEALIVDLGIRGVWEPQATGLFDIHVVLTLMPGLICSILLQLYWPPLKLRRSRSIVMVVPSVMPPLPLCAFWWMVLLEMRLLGFLNIWLGVCL